MKALLIVFILALIVSTVTAVETGRITGIVVTAETGKPLPYANVVVVGTKMGGMTLTDGTFTIVGVPAGTYTVKVMMMGYKPVDKHNVVVEPGETVKIEFKMEEQIVGRTQEIVVGAEQVQIDVKGSSVPHSQSLPAPGVPHIRGGRSGNVQFQLGGCRPPGYYCPPGRHYPNTEEYDQLDENDFMPVIGNPLSTFSIDVDVASYANTRRFIMADRLPPKDAIRVEEFINYFDYDYEKPDGDVPFSINLEYAVCPWNAEHNLVHIGLQGEELVEEDRRPSNLVFLIDVSGSMEPENKLPLLQKAFLLLVDELADDDQVAIVTYACQAGVALEPTFGRDRKKIKHAIRRLHAGGSTAGHAGIQLAYDLADACFIPGGNNRVILATDGDFNVGVSNTPELVEMIEEKRDTGIFLTILGFGIGNYKDGRLEQLADKGNGNHAYIDNLLEAKKVFVDDLTSTLYTIAKDVKIQVEFNPVKVASYRLIGYENRLLNKEDFADDKKDAGEIGAGHSVTALYEIVPAEYGDDDVLDDGTIVTGDLKYMEAKLSPEALESGEIVTVHVRYKEPDDDTSKLITNVIAGEPVAVKKSSNALRFSAAVAMYAMILRESAHTGDIQLENVRVLAKGAMGDDPHMYRAEFIRQVERTMLIVDLASK